MPRSADSSLQARSNWSRLQLDARGKPGKHLRSRGVARGQRSPIAKMLDPDSGTWLSFFWMRIQTLSIVVSFAVHVAATNAKASQAFGSALNVLEDVTSGIFTADYLARLYACRERRRYSALGVFEARMQWALSWEALVMVASCFPIVVDGNSSVWLTLPRILLLFRASRWGAAVRTAKRVVFVNRDILYTSLALVSLTILISATLLYATCAPHTECAKENGIVDLPSATFVATMMLTGQASPEGGLSAPAFRAVVVLLAFLSVPFYAVPAAMLTWGFEGEAQRLVSREARKVARKRAYAEDPRMLESSSDSEDEEYESYMETLGGDEDSAEAEEAASARALEFFESAGRRGLQASPAPAAAGGGTVGGAPADLRKAAEGSLLLRAQRLAHSLQRDTRLASRQRQRQRDAYGLLEKVAEEFDEGLSSDQAQRLEGRLRAFAAAVAEDDVEDSPHKGGKAAATGSAAEPESVEARVADMQRDLTNLRRTTVAGLAELKSAINELAQRLPAN